MATAKDFIIQDSSLEMVKVIRPGFEPRTACVLDRSDNQLHHRTDSNVACHCAYRLFISF